MENTKGHLFEQSMNQLRIAALADFETLVIIAALEEQIFHSQPHLEMRARAIVELICHSYHYFSIQEMLHTNDNQLLFWLSHYSSTADTSCLDMTVKQNTFEVLKAVLVESLAPNSWVGMWHLAALASVSQKQ